MKTLSFLALTVTFLASISAFGEIKLSPMLAAAAQDNGGYIDDTIESASFVAGDSQINLLLKSGTAILFSGEDLGTGRVMALSLGKTIRVVAATPVKITVLGH